MKGLSIIVMGVSGSGKSTVGSELAQALRAKFIDGDDLHPKSNVNKMALGNALDDSDRKPWLDRINDAVYSIHHKQETCVIVCSALKKKYRDHIRLGNENVMFVFLDGSKETISSRMLARRGHYMKEAMLTSQFDALERPIEEPDVVTIDISYDRSDVVHNALREIKNAQ